MPDIDQSVQSLARTMFREFYRKHPITISNLTKREFGFGTFDKKIAKRHMAFNNAESLNRYIDANSPAFISASPAFYENPSGRPMETKGWLGSELVFDLDASDLHLECQKRHGTSWVCPNCLHEVKREAFKLIEEFLIPDFGFSNKEIKINFSGNRGYHIIIGSESVLTLDEASRSEISDYVTGRGLEPESFFPNIADKSSRLQGPKPNDPGWGGRMARSLVTALNAGETQLQALGMTRQLARKMYLNKPSIVLGITTGNWDKVSIPKKDEFWRKVAESMTIKQSDSIDSNVTKNPQHLLGMADTLHGGTGLVAKSVESVSAFERFDPMKDCIAFEKGETLVVADTKEKLTMNGMEYGPFENKKAVLPNYAAMYLLLKGVAKLP
ncbi:DNA primase [Candidatus Micrarchaeum sp.]|jgi:DNA primase small subunit|uniref:DNA primase catalytic subunit PriS n=1 Tax=Candidatus Micrarchaeum sp. TaxID=2282148 RepID=UPI001AF1648E|nr:DNA primase catalytic subunit PriS [Candidatus Micrarchaeum sp.]QRF73727.1 DNA primase [Candidatus Micrarchaeum sp.]